MTAAPSAVPFHHVSLVTAGRDDTHPSQSDFRRPRRVVMVLAVRFRRLTPPKPPELCDRFAAAGAEQRAPPGCDRERSPTALRNAVIKGVEHESRHFVIQPAQPPPDTPPLVRFKEGGDVLYDHDLRPQCLGPSDNLKTKRVARIVRPPSPKRRESLARRPRDENIATPLGLKTRNVSYLHTLPRFRA